MKKHSVRPQPPLIDLPSLVTGTLELESQVALRTELERFQASQDPHHADAFASGFQKATELLTASTRRLIEAHLQPEETSLRAAAEKQRPRWALRFEPEAWQLVDTQASHILSEITALAKDAKKPAVVFDLDGTLVDVAFRTLGILKEWLGSKASANFSESLVEQLRGVDLTHIGYSLADAFENAGIDLRDEQAAHVFESAENHWRRRFFDGKALVEYDRIIPGAREFVHTLQSSEVAIMYLTGRNAQTMEAGTRRQLEQLGLPLSGTRLYMKHDSHKDDHLFKKEVFAELSSEFQIVGNFENEYLNLKTMMDLIPGTCLHTIVDSQHSARPVPAHSQKVYRIQNFL